MREILYIVMLWSTGLMFSQTNSDSLFQEGNELYRKEHFEQAITKYETILKSDFESLELYFNLGNCYYKTGKIAPAIYYFEKALLLNPNDESVKTNLTFAQNLAIDDIKVVPNVGFANFLYKLTLWFTIDTWGMLAVVFSFVILVLFIGYYFSGRTLLKRIFFVAMFVFLGFLFWSMSMGLLQKRYANRINPAIVFDEVVNVKSEPKNSAENVVVLHEGAKVYVKETIDGWKRIELTDKTQGWIKKETIKELK